MCLLSAGALHLAGCASTASAPLAPREPLVPGSAFSGTVHSGSQALAHASVMLYAAGATGYGSSGTALLPAPVETDVNGKFTIASGYFCPSIGAAYGPSTPVYLLASGGGVGLLSGKTNPASLLVAGVGACNGVTPATTVVVNEVSTAAAAWAFRPFLSAGGSIGGSPGSAAGINHAFATLLNLENPALGSSPGAAVAANVIVPVAKINALANVLAACVGSDGTGACVSLFAASSAPDGSLPTNTADAAWNIVRQPAANVAAVSSLVAAQPPFQPSLGEAPADWTLNVRITGGGMNSPTAVSVDAAGDVWVANYAAVLSEFTHLGSPVIATGLTGDGLTGAYGVAIDASDNIWVPNNSSAQDTNAGKGSLTELTTTGQPLSGSNGYVLGNLNSPVAMAADPNGDVWAVNYYNASATLYQHPASGPLAINVTAPGKLGFPNAIAIDAGHNAWVTTQGTPTVTRISADTKEVTTYSCCHSPAGVAVDQGGNIWVANYSGNSVSELSNTGTVLLNGQAGGGLEHPQGIAIDGAGTVWLTDALTLGGGLSELSGAHSVTPGTPLSPAAGLGVDAALSLAYGVALDDSGDVWITSFGDNSLTEFVGLAAPVRTPVIGPPQLP